MRTKKQAAVVIPTVSISPEQTAFSVKQAAVYLGMSAWSVRVAIWRGELPARKNKHNIVVLRSDADKFLAALPVVEPCTSEWFARREVRT